MPLRMPWPEPKRSIGRRRSKNSGGGIAPAAIAVLIEVCGSSVNAFERGCGRRGRSRGQVKGLMRLNFRGSPATG